MPILLSLALADEAATRSLAEGLASRARAGDVLALAGDLGAGKTAFARAFIRRLTDPEEDVPSPTFTLAQIYDTETARIWHFDLYRLEKPDDAFELGIEEAFADGISLIEWPDRLGGLLPRDHLTLHIAAGAEPTARTITFEGPAAWRDRLQDLTP